MCSRFQFNFAHKFPQNEGLVKILHFWTNIFRQARSTFFDDFLTAQNLGVQSPTPIPLPRRHWRLGLHLAPHWGSLQHSPNPLAGGDLPKNIPHTYTWPLASNFVFFGLWSAPTRQEVNTCGEEVSVVYLFTPCQTFLPLFLLAHGSR